MSGWSLLNFATRKRAVPSEWWLRIPFEISFVPSYSIMNIPAAARRIGNSNAIHIPQCCNRHVTSFDAREHATLITHVRCCYLVTVVYEAEYYYTDWKMKNRKAQFVICSIVGYEIGTFSNFEIERSMSPSSSEKKKEWHVKRLCQFYFRNF